MENNIKALVETYKIGLRNADFSSAMEAFFRLHASIELKRDPDFTYNHYIRPVLDDGLMEIKECRNIVKLMEAHALLRSLNNEKEATIVCSVEDSLALGRLGLKEIGEYAFRKAAAHDQPLDLLVSAEAAFDKQFSVRDLLHYHYVQGMESSLDKFCYLYLSREGANLPVNCPRSIEVERECGMFGDHVTKPEMLNGVGEAIRSSRKAPAKRKLDMVVDLIEALEPEKKATLLEVLKQEVGEPLVMKAEREIQKLSNPSNNKKKRAERELESVFGM